jgi:hypothetical protein
VSQILGGGHRAGEGLWITCGASLSPWKHALSSEEYEPTPRTGRQTAEGLQPASLRRAAKANPYHYGHLPEIRSSADGTGIV